VGLALVDHTDNRVRLVPTPLRWKQGSIKVEAPLRVVRRNVLVEQTLGLAIVIIVGWLGTLETAIAAQN
jgi:hypothetical protein